MPGNSSKMGQGLDNILVAPRSGLGLSPYEMYRVPTLLTQGGFRKGRGTKVQIANIRWIIEKAREFQENIYFCFIDYAKASVWITINCGKF